VIDEIGKRDPRWPQIFATVAKEVTVQKGDTLMATCRYDSSQRNRMTGMG
jgi:hypothetical protein